jgi:Flp pilus assembly protein TadD
LLGRAGLELYDRARPQLFCLYIQGTDEIAHNLTAYAPPPLAGVSPEDRALFGRGVETYYSWVDGLIGAVAERAARDRADVLVLSDHGFKWAEERPSPSTHASTDFRTASFWHRLDGILLAWGPGVAVDPSRKTASVFDVAPTLCALLRLPPDPRMEGRVLEDLFRPGVLQPQAAEDWRRIAQVRRASVLPVSAAEADRSVQKLLALGYISPSQAAPAVREARPAEGVRTSGAWNNLGLFWKEQGRPGKAREAFLRARSMAPSEYGPAVNLSEVDRAAGREEESTKMLIEAGRLGYPDFAGLVLVRVREDVSSGRAARARALLERTTRALPGETRLLPVLGRLQLESRACAVAEATFERYLDQHPDDFDTWNAAASAALCRGDRRSAITRFRKSLAVRPDQPRVEEELRRLSAVGSP